MHLCDRCMKRFSIYEKCLSTWCVHVIQNCFWFQTAHHARWITNDLSERTLAFVSIQFEINTIISENQLKMCQKFGCFSSKNMKSGLIEIIFTLMIYQDNLVVCRNPASTVHSPKYTSQSVITFQIACLMISAIYIFWWKTPFTFKYPLKILSSRVF